MASIGSFLAMIAAPVAKRVLTGLGVGVITYAGLDSALGVIQNAVINNLGGMSGDLANFFALAGGNQVIGITLGALAARVTMATLTRLGRLN
ncbi:MAG: DUF2523 domain-containing protein [Pseudomonadota bacterium]